MIKMVGMGALVIAAMVAGWEGKANAQNIVVKGNIDLPGPWNPEFTVTVGANGTVTVEVPGPNPAPGQIPPAAIPPGCPPAPGPVNVGLCADEKDCMKKVAAAIAGFLIRRWIEHGIKLLKEWLESVKQWILELRQKFLDMLGDIFGQKQKVEGARAQAVRAGPGVNSLFGALLPVSDPAPVDPEPIDPVLPSTWAQDVAELTVVYLDDWAATQP